MLVATGNETTSPGIDVALVTGVRIGSLVHMAFMFSVVLIVGATECLVSGALSWGSDVFLGRTNSTKVLPILKRVKVHIQKKIIRCKINSQQKNKIQYF